MKRKFEWLEVWDGDLKKIVARESYSIPDLNGELSDYIKAMPAHVKGTAALEDMAKQLVKNPKAVWNEIFSSTETLLRWKADIYDNLKASLKYEPAYSYANARCDFWPKPWNGQISKLEQESRMHEWNKRVDEYIALGQDKRPRIDIDRLAKIGTHGGPLYRTCELEGCGKYESGDVHLKTCRQCKKIIYCSRECQTADWKRHKQECMLGCREQQLPSQWLIEGAVVLMPLQFMFPDGTAGRSGKMLSAAKDILHSRNIGIRG